MHGRLPPLARAILLSLSPLARGQERSFDDSPKPYVPKRPPTRAEIDRRESLKTYVYGLLCEREDRLLEALKAYQDAARLDPGEAAVIKAQVPILLALDR